MVLLILKASLLRFGVVVLLCAFLFSLQVAPLLLFHPHCRPVLYVPLLLLLDYTSSQSPGGKP